MNLPIPETFNSLWANLPNRVRIAETTVRAWFGREIADARFYYTRFRAENGDALNQFRFGMLFETGHRVSQSDYEAHKWFLRAAFQGLVDAQAKVSEYHLLGRGVPRNNEEAFRWCRKAAEAGHAPSQAQLARMYAHGIGVERNPKEAKKWVGKAATQSIQIPKALQVELTAC
ncbi:MAG TPA: tetratricopeptide repeat protein [Verrucomicrobiae bacterium]|nr:tetratricopeptide repeat protein [Verrucomicrobiae bacterium]